MRTLGDLETSLTPYSLAVETGQRAIESSSLSNRTPDSKGELEAFQFQTAGNFSRGSLESMFLYLFLFWSLAFVRPVH